MAHCTDLDVDLEQRARVLDAWVDTRRRIAALEAEAAELLMEQLVVHDRDVAEHPFHRDAIHRSMIAEYSVAGRLPRTTVELAFDDARSLATSLPAVRAAFGEARISAQHVREIVRASCVISEAIRLGRADADIMSVYEAAVLVVAERETAARTRPHAQQVASALVGETVIERHRRAAAERSVTVRSADDGLAVLTAILPEWAAHAVADRLTQMARMIVRTRDDAASRAPESDAPLPASQSGDHGADGENRAIFSVDGDTFTLDPGSESHDRVDDQRTLDQIRADVLADMLLTASPSDTAGDALGSVRARVQVTVSASTLAGLDDRPAELDRLGPLDPEIARALAGRHSGWTRLFLDPDGLVRETDTYTPTEGMKRFLRARDQHCRFPGCRMPVHRCQIDHNHDHAKGGPTSLDNLAHLCVGHHSLKHPDVPDHSRWTARQQHDGSITWESPLGRTYTDHPRRRVMFS